MTSWRGAYACALQVFGETISAGHDYAQTELVHCGSAKQAGVQPALPVCTAFYLRPVLRAAKRARVIVAVGRWAEIAFLDVLRIETSERIAQPGMVEGIRRVVLFVAHPAAREVDADAKRLSATQVTAARVSLGLGVPTPEPQVRRPNLSQPATPATAPTAMPRKNGQEDAP